MPYLSWLEGSQLMRYAVREACQVGRDPLVCAVAQPNFTELSRIHASIDRIGGIWWVRDLDSANGTLLNGQTLRHPQGNALRDGDALVMGGWHLTFSEGFPGLDGTTFAERVGDLFQEVRPEPAQAMVLIRSIELLQRSTEKLLQQVDSDAMVKGLLDESLLLLSADRGFLVMKSKEGGWRTAHRVGDVQEGIGLSRSILDYVAQERTAIMSNQPLADPRFAGVSLVELHRGSILCAPMVDDGEIHGALYLDRESEGRPFSRFDLAVFQAFVRLGSMALRQAMLNRRVLSQAEQQGELLRLRTERQREAESHGELLAAMAAPLRRVQSWAEGLADVTGGAIRPQLEQLATLLECGSREGHADDVPMAGHSMPVAALQEDLVQRWESLLRLRKARLSPSEAPAASVWMTGGPLVVALAGLVEPMLMQVPRGDVVAMRWDQERGFWVLRLNLPGRVACPHSRSLDPAPAAGRWGALAVGRSGSGPLPSRRSRHHARGTRPAPPGPGERRAGPAWALPDRGRSWKSLAAPPGAGTAPAAPPQVPVPGGGCSGNPGSGGLHPRLSPPSILRHDAHPGGALLRRRNPEAHRGRRHRLAGRGLPLEALHHRLQVLRGHTELQQRALATERLESFRQMAGTLKHEINNPLAIISMQVEMLQRKYPEEGKLEKIGEMVDRIRALVQVLQKMRETPTEDYADGSSILKVGKGG